MQKVNFVGRWRGVHIDDKCPNFYPSSTFKAGARATRRIPLTRGKFVLVDAEDYYRLVKFRWTASASGNTFYASRGHNGTTLMMHRAIMGAPKHLVVDHIDHNGLNNRRSNLRLSSLAQNSCNVVSRKGTSKYKGVHWKRINKKWVASIQLNGKAYHLGCFADEIAAAIAYDEKAKVLHREFACLNFPPKK
jgi:hypothetical protein